MHDFSSKEKKGRRVSPDIRETVKNFQRRRCLSSTCPVDRSSTTDATLSITHTSQFPIFYKRIDIIHAVRVGGEERGSPHVLHARV